MPFFNDVFDALCKLSADSDPNVQVRGRARARGAWRASRVRLAECCAPAGQVGEGHCDGEHVLQARARHAAASALQADALAAACSVEAFIPLLRERLTVLNPYVRQFLVGWITVLDSVPDIDMLEYLPDFLDGMLNMLSDPNREIRQQADTALAEFLHEVKSAAFVDYRRLTEILVTRAASPDEFTMCVRARCSSACCTCITYDMYAPHTHGRLTAITWLHEFVELGRDRMMPYSAAILGAVLPCLAHPEERVAAVASRCGSGSHATLNPRPWSDERAHATRTNEALLALHPSASDGFDLRAVLAVLEQEVSEGKEPTRLAALKCVTRLAAD